MRKQLLALSLLLVSAASALADSTPHWLQVKTEHFTVLTDGSDRQARHVAGQLERMHAVYAKLLPNASADAGSPIVVLALKDRKDFQAIEPASYLGKDSLDLVGLFLRAMDKNYILLRLDTSGEHPYSTVYHEYTHYMLRRAEFIPVWLNEGLAQFYQNTDIDNKGVRLGQISGNEILYLRKQRLMPLATLFAVDRNSPFYHDEQKGSVFYAESWALTHLLTMQDRVNKTQLLHDYVVRLTNGEGPVAAGEHAFGNLERLQMSLQAYINQGDFKALTMPLQNTIDEASLKVEPISTPDVDAVRADVLADDGRKQEAEALIDSVLRDAPGNAQAHESMGLLKLREGDLEGARKWYGEAVALHSSSYLAYYYFGTLSMHNGAVNAGEAAGDSLLQATKLNPDFAPAFDALAQFYASHHEHLDEALDASMRAIQFEPRNINYRLNEAQVLVERKEVPMAISALQSVAKSARNPDDAARVQARLDQLQRSQDR